MGSAKTFYCNFNVINMNYKTFRPRFKKILVLVKPRF